MRALRGTLNFCSFRSHAGPVIATQLGVRLLHGFLECMTARGHGGRSGERGGACRARAREGVQGPRRDAGCRGYSSAEALRLINFSRGHGISRRNVSGQTVSLPQPRQEIAAIPDQCRETPLFIDRLGSETSVTIFPVALPFRRTTAGRAAMHSATDLTGDRWRLAWRPAPRPR